MGVYLSEPETSKQIHLKSEGQITYVSGEMQGWRKNMEDAAINQIDIGDGNSLFAVFDGHGGAEVSYYVKEVFIDTLKHLPQYKEKNYVRALDIAFMKIDKVIDSEDGNKRLREIRKKLTGTPDGNNPNAIGNGTGCTANVILITPQKYIIANSGDSRSALSRSGKLVVFSEDHKPQSPQQERRIVKAGGSIMMGRVNGGLNLTRSFGDFDYKRNNNLEYHQQMITCKPDIREISKDKGDQFIIMGCDGIWERYVDDSTNLIEILKRQLKSGKELRTIMENLLDMLLAKDTRQGIGCDNMTAILITLKKTNDFL